MIKREEEAPESGCRHEHPTRPKTMTDFAVPMPFQIADTPVFIAHPAWVNRPSKPVVAGSNPAAPTTSKGLTGCREPESPTTTGILPSFSAGFAVLVPCRGKILSVALGPR